MASLRDLDDIKKKQKTQVKKPVKTEKPGSMIIDKIGPKRSERSKNEMLQELEKSRPKGNGNLPFKDYVKNAMDEIKVGHLDAGIDWLVAAVKNLEQRDPRKAASLIEGAVNKILFYSERPNYMEYAAFLYENWLVPRYNALDMSANAEASRGKAIDIGSQVAYEKGLERLVEFYIDKCLDGAIIDLFSPSKNDFSKTFNDVLRVSTINDSHLTELERQEKRDYKDQIWGALYLAAEHFANKDPGFTGSMLWKMGQIAENMGDYGRNYEIAKKRYKAALAYLKKDGGISNSEILRYHQSYQRFLGKIGR